MPGILVWGLHLEWGSPFIWVVAGIASLSIPFRMILIDALIESFTSKINDFRV
jgi:hypothetical protein